jgi:hypothetical protein
MFDSYRDWSLSVSYRRQVIFVGPKDEEICAIDYEGFIKDGDKGWVDRIERTIKAKIDCYIEGEFSDAQILLEAEIAKLIRHNFKCHKVLLRDQQEMTTIEAENEFNLASGTVRAALVRGVIEGRKSGSTWLVKRGVLKNHYLYKKGIEHE